MRVHFLGLVFIFLVLVACSSPEPVAEPAEAEPQADIEPVEEAEIKILAFGDSLTEGFGVEPDLAYPAQLERKLHDAGYAEVEVINGGISGETSTAGLTRIDWMLNLEPDIAIVTTGGNDGLRGVDLDLTRSNIDEIVAKLQAEGVIVVVGGMQIIENLGEEYTTEFQSIYPDVAEKHDTILIPFFLEGVAADPELNQADFIHPTAEGYTIIVDNIFPYIEEAIASLGS